MIWLLCVLASLVCSCIWVGMLVMGRRQARAFGFIFETWMFASVAFAVLGTLLHWIGI